MNSVKMSIAQAKQNIKNGSRERMVSELWGFHKVEFDDKDLVVWYESNCNNKCLTNYVLERCLNYVKCGRVKLLSKYPNLIIHIENPTDDEKNVADMNKVCKHKIYKRLLKRQSVPQSMLNCLSEEDKNDVIYMLTSRINMMNVISN